MPESEQLQDSGGGNVVVLKRHGDRHAAIDKVFIATSNGSIIIAYDIFGVIGQGKGIHEFRIDCKVAVERYGKAH